MTKTIEALERRITLPPLPEIDDVTRREFLIGSTGLLLLPLGCGERGPGGDGQGSARTRDFTDETGRVEIPAEPRLWKPQDFLGEELEGVERVGNDSGEANLERIAASEPDLIVIADWQEHIYDNLSEIAPTVAVARGDFTEWREPLRVSGDLLGRREEADELIADYERRVAEVRESIGEDRLEETEVTAFAPSGSGALQIWVESGLCDAVMADIGVRRPQAQKEALEAEENPDVAGRLDNVSFERITLLDADVIFLGALSPDVRADGIENLKSSPLWKRLDAVEQGRVHQVDGNAWNEGSVLAANLILDDLEKHLTDSEGAG